MPRDRKAARERNEAPPALRPFGVEAPEWARREGFEVRMVLNPRLYRCPGCEHEIRASTQHLVVVPRDAVEDRRHWHTECWRRELRRLGGVRR